MAKTSVKGPGGHRQRAVAAAARAAAKRAERAERTRDPGGPPPVVAGPTVVVDDTDSHRPGERPDPPRADGLPRDVAARSAAGAARVTAAPSSGDTPASGAHGRAAPAVRSGRAPGGGRFHGRHRLFRRVLALVTLAAVAATGLLGWEYRQAELTRQARTQATSVAREAAPKILSYDHRHLEEDFDAARAHLTGSFRQEFARTTKKVVTPSAGKYHGVVKASIAEPPGGSPAVSVVSASPDEVVILLFMNQVTRSTKLDEPRMDLNRVRMTLVDTPDGWKVGAVDAL